MGRDAWRQASDTSLGVALKAAQAVSGVQVA